MIWRRVMCSSILVLCAAQALAEAPLHSIHPVHRPDALATPETAMNPGNPGQGAAIPFMVVPADNLPARVATDLFVSPVPRMRPTNPSPEQSNAGPDILIEPVVQAQAALSSSSASTVVPEPRARKGLFSLFKANSTRTRPDPATIIGRDGSVCGVPEIRGRTLPLIASPLQGCGVDRPVEVTSVDGIALTPPATLDCATAVALVNWVHSAVKPTFDGKGGGLEALRVADSYDCRTRNHVSGARISEHGKGKAIDISGFLLASGAEVTVANDYRRGAYSKPLKAVYHAACGPFGTTLGPGSDGMHEDHIHMDTASYRNGAYCK